MCEEEEPDTARGPGDPVRGEKWWWEKRSHETDVLRDRGGMTGPDWQEAPAEGKPESASDCSHTALLSCQHPGYNLNSGAFDCDIFCFFVAFVWAQSKWGRVKWKHREGKKTTTLSRLTHKRKHLSVRTLLFKNVSPRSLSDVRTSSPHAVRLLLKSRREQFSLPDSWVDGFSSTRRKNELRRVSFPNDFFLSACTRISVRVVIGELHSYKCTHYCVN